MKPFEAALYYLLLTPLRTNPEEAEHSAPNLLESLVCQAEKVGASDIHLQMVGKSAEVSFRLDGLMTRVTELPESIAERVFGRIKYLARLKTYQDSLPRTVGSTGQTCRRGVTSGSRPTQPSPVRKLSFGYSTIRLFAIWINLDWNRISALPWNNSSTEPRDCSC